MKNYSDEFEFISIVIPALDRYHYLEALVESIHRNADMPFEIIVHDDSSTDGSADATYNNLKNKVSSIIFNRGLPLGLSEGVNRCVSIAGSRYILMLNSDMVIERPMFRDIVNVLKVPFVGHLTPLSTASIDNIGYINNGTKFYMHMGLGSGCAMAFRKDVFIDAGGWDNVTVASSNADVSFMARTIKAGYFSANIGNKDPYIRNVSLDKLNNSDSTISNIQHGVSFPRLFAITDGQFRSMSRQRFDKASDDMQISYRKDGGDVNAHYWRTYNLDLVDESEMVNWDVAVRHGQYRWRDVIENYRIK